MRAHDFGRFRTNSRKKETFTIFNGSSTRRSPGKYPLRDSFHFFCVIFSKFFFLIGNQNGTTSTFASRKR